MAHRSVAVEMKQLLKIVGAGALAFIAVAILQEWELFATAWFGRPAATLVLSEADRAEASANLERALALVRHYYASGGDPRFAERLPVGDELRAEMTAEIEYLAKNRRRQQLDLHRLEIAEARPLDRDHVEVRTREYWTIRTLPLDGAGETDRPRPEILTCRYLLARAGTAWRVERWEVVSAGEVAGR